MWPTQLTDILFFVAAAVLIAAALGVITASNPVRAVLSLIVAFFATSVLWILTQAEFLALTLIIVYVGAVMVLFLFVVMMLNINVAEIKEKIGRFYPLGLAAGFLLLFEMFWVLAPGASPFLEKASVPERAADYSNIKELGTLLFKDYLLPFEVAGVVLLAAIVACIALAFRGPRQRRGQNVPSQVAARASHRVQLIDIPPEGSS